MKKTGNKYSRYNFWIATSIVSIAVVIILFLVLRQLSGIRNDYREQIRVLTTQDQETRLTNQLLKRIFDIQSYTDVRSLGKEERELEKDTLILLRDSLFKITENDRVKESVSEIFTLLDKKDKNRKSIEKRLRQLNPIRKINKEIEENKKKSQEISTEQADSQIVARTITDTLVFEEKKRNFWQRLGYAFSPKKHQHTDSVQYISRTIVDTLVSTKQLDSIQIVSELLEKTLDKSQRYDQDIRTIIAEVNGLMRNEIVISSKISSILIELHESRFRTVNRNLTESIEEINSLYSRTLVAGVISVIILLFLLGVIINNFNMLKKSNQELEEEKRRVTELLESRHQLLLHVAHDIKTPLSSIIGYLNMWEQNSEVENMLGSARYINSLLENLLKYSSLAQGKLEVEREEVDIHETIEKTLSLFWNISKSKQITIVSHNRIEEGLIIESDPLKIEQILMNLVSNSIKYSNENTTVEVEGRIEDQQLILSVADHGIGIEKEKLSRIFELFDRIEDGRRMSTGDGVGMSVVKGMVDILQGKIDIVSEKDKGTTITVQIPIREIRKAGSKKKEEKDYSALKIGIIDDDEVLITVLADLFRKSGVEEVVTFRKLTELEKSLSAERFDVLLTDWDMGDFSGFDVLQKVRESAQGRDTYVAVATGRNDLTSEDIRKLGFNDIIFKPISAHTLSCILNRFDGRKTAENHKTIFEMFADDEESIAKIIDTFKDSAKKDLEDLSTALEQEDRKRFLGIVHKIRPGFIQLGADIELVESLNRFNSLYQQEETDAESFPVESGKELIEKARCFTEQLSCRQSS